MRGPFPRPWFIHLLVNCQVDNKHKTKPRKRKRFMFTIYARIRSSASIEFGKLSFWNVTKQTVGKSYAFSFNFLTFFPVPTHLIWLPLTHFISKRKPLPANKIEKIAKFYIPWRCTSKSRTPQIETKQKYIKIHCQRLLYLGFFWPGLCSFRWCIFLLGLSSNDWSFIAPTQT